MNKEEIDLTPKEHIILLKAINEYKGNSSKAEKGIMVIAYKRNCGTIKSSCKKDTIANVIASSINGGNEDIQDIIAEVLCQIDKEKWHEIESKIILR